MARPSRPGQVASLGGKVELEGLIALAEAKEPAGPQVFVFGVFLFEATNYWIGVRTAPVEQRASVFPRFRKIAASFERE